MTEHTKIPVPGEPEKGNGEGTAKPGRNSLLERAETRFAGGSFKPAPVPRDLAPGPVKRGRKKAPVETAAPPVPERAPAAAPVQAAPAQVPAEAIAAPAAQTPPVLVEPARFTARTQPIDTLRLKEQGFVQPDGGVSGLLEELRIVKRSVLYAVREARAAGKGLKAQRVLVCSPLPGEGKTFCATNLALALAAEKDVEVILADADFAKPSVLGVLGLESTGGGLMDALANADAKVEDLVIPTDIGGLYVLPAGSQTQSDSEYVASGRTSAVLDRLVEGAPDRIVIFDSPPALAASPAGELAKHVGLSLLIARADKTGQSALDDALSLLEGCEDIRLLLNQASFSPSGRRFGTYYGYGEKS
jgi:Mrp family chromosome partitioning ATPase